VAEEHASALLVAGKYFDAGRVILLLSVTVFGQGQHRALHWPFARDSSTVGHRCPEYHGFITPQQFAVPISAELQYR